MEYLFKYIKTLSFDINSQVEDLVAFQRIFDAKKSSEVSQENLRNCEGEIKKNTLYLRILEQISYLEDYKIDINRSIEALDRFLETDCHRREDAKQISYFLSGLCSEYNIEYFESSTETSHDAPQTLQHHMATSLDEVMKTIEEILLSFYGLISPVEDLEEKLIKRVEELFNLRLEDLEMEEKLLVEDFFNNIQYAFQEKCTEGWENAYIKCTGILNDLKSRAGIEVSSALQITFESDDEDDGDDYIIEFELDEEFDSEDDEDEDDFGFGNYDDEDY